MKKKDLSRETYNLSDKYIYTRGRRQRFYSNHSRAALSSPSPLFLTINCMTHSATQGGLGKPAAPYYRHSFSLTKTRGAEKIFTLDFRGFRCVRVICFRTREAKSCIFSHHALNKHIQLENFRVIHDCNIRAVKSVNEMVRHERPSLPEICFVSKIYRFLSL